MATIIVINIGTVPNDKTGDALRDAMNYVNQNFQALNSQANTNTNNITLLSTNDTNDKMFSQAGTTGDNIITIPGGGYSDANYTYMFQAYDTNGFQVSVRYVSRTSTTITLNLPQAATIIVRTKK